MSVYYNEFDPFAAAWLRELIKAGLIAPGDVDDRSIRDVQPGDLAGYTQCHFFAGIGGWSYAARLAGWPDDRPLWTGSCPCQPFSVAGKGGGVDDPRHLWPDFLRLIRACRPPVVMGEQVAGSLGYGWFDGVRADLAREGYAGRGVDIPACAVDAPHIRNRLYWVGARDVGVGHVPVISGLASAGQQPLDEPHAGTGLWAGPRHGVGLADANPVRGLQPEGRLGAVGGRPANGDDCFGVGQADTDSQGSLSAAQTGVYRQAQGGGSWDVESKRHDGPDRDSLADTGRGRSGWRAIEPGGNHGHGPAPGRVEGAGGIADGDEGGVTLGDAERAGLEGLGGDGVDGAGRSQPDGPAPSPDGRNGSFWSACDWIACHDGKARRTEPGASLLAHGVSARVAKWRGFGNAIVPQEAAQVIAAWMDVAA